MKRRSMVRAALAAPAWCALPARAADPWPARPLRLIIPFGPGLSTDAIARHFAQEMGPLIGQTVVAENRAGTQGIVGSKAVATSAPDGLTLVFASNGSHAANVAMFKSLPYDPVADFAPIGAISAAPWGLAVRNDLPARDLPGFLALAREKPGVLSVAHGSASSHACVALLESLGKVDVNDVPYKSLQPATIDLQAGRLDAAFLPLGVSVLAQQAGRQRVIGTSATKRSPLAPEVPAIAEVLPGYELTSWVGLMAPAGTPAPVIARLHDAMKQVLARDDTRAMLARFGHEPLGDDPATFGKRIRDDIVMWKRHVATAGIEPL